MLITLFNKKKIFFMLKQFFSSIFTGILEILPRIGLKTSFHILGITRIAFKKASNGSFSII